MRLPTLLISEEGHTPKKCTFADIPLGRYFVVAQYLSDPVVLKKIQVDSDRIHIIDVFTGLEYHEALYQSRDVYPVDVKMVWSFIH